jgi:hypothetical protein
MPGFHQHLREYLLGGYYFPVRTIRLSSSNQLRTMLIIGVLSVSVG